MLKTYELATRHFGWEKPPRAATPGECDEYLLERALRSQGLVSLGSICHGEAGRKKAMQRLIDRRVRRGELVPVTVGGVAHWARPAELDRHLEPCALVHILSPFDPLVIQRRRLKLFFGYEHVFEAYVPQEKRRYGYFTHPVLAGDEIAAVLDLKTDRERGKLLVRRWTWIAAGARRELKRRIEDALHRFERFQLERE